MNRVSKLSVLVALALASTQALALDLGRIQVKSALDQPLLAEIPVHPDHPGEADHLTATLAPTAAFERAGVDRAALEVPLAFTVVTGADGNRFIRVTSKQPVRKPYLDFLVQVTWPQGKMLREYVVLLDPVGMTSHPSTVPATTTGRVPASTHPTPQPAPTPAAGPASGNGQGGGTYGPVTYGDTLSHIAHAHAIDGVSYQQMLVALKAANPDAFFRNNVNALKTGAVLRIPTRTQALSVTRTAAIAAVREQNQAWRDVHASPTTVASAGGSSAPVSASGPGAQGEDRLALVPPGQSARSNAAAAGSGQAAATASELRQDLARSKEALSSQQQANADLQSRVKALEQIADKNKRLLRLQNAEIATLQAKLAEARKQAGLPALPASSLAAAAASVTPAAVPAVVGGKALATAASTAGATAVPAAAGTTKAATVAASTAVPAHAKATPQAAQHASPARSAQAAENSAPWYEQLWARIVLVIILILLIIWAFLHHRKSSGNTGKTGKERKPSLADQFDDSSFGRKAGAADADATDAQVASDVDDEDEDALLTQLAEHPDNVDLHLELVGLYYDRHDASSFEGAAEAMHAYVDDEDQPEWQDVLAMGRELAPDHPLFAAAATRRAEADEDDDFASEVPSAAVDVPEDFDHHFEPTSDPLSADFHDEFVETEHEPESGTPTGLPDESEFDALPPLPPVEEDDPVAREPESPPQPADETDAADLSAESSVDASTDGFFDDPVDTKLDLARAYIDMGDHEGARAMLQEALHEGSQVQKDAARKLLDDLD